MLSSLILLGVVLGPRNPVAIQNPQFPKPNLDISAILQDSSVFKYLSADDKKLQWKPLVVGRDWSNLAVPEIKPGALKLKVLLAVAERDFSDPEFSNTLESRDRLRLIEAIARLKSLFAVISDGTISLEIVPRFIAEPIYNIQEFKQYINAEFNKSKFESDDSAERGPFASVVAISSSHVNDKPDPNDDYAVHGMSDIGGSSQDMWLEESLFYLVQSGIFSRLSKHYTGFGSGYTDQDTKSLLMDRLATMRGEFQQLFDPNFRKDSDLVSKWAQQTLRQPGRPIRIPEMAAIESPAALKVADGVLNYSELSILRAGEFALPPSAKWSTQKALRFEFRSKNPNPISVKLKLKNGTGLEVNIGGEPGMIPIAKDSNWQSITVPFPSEGVEGATVGASTVAVGKTRLRSELVQCDFRNFELVSDANPEPNPVNPAPQSLNDETSIKLAITTGNKTTKRKALANIELIKGLKGLESTLLATCSDLDAGVARDATKAYFELVLANQPSPDQLSTLGKFLVAPPNEAAREVALLYTAKNPAYAKFDMVVGNTVRDSWRVRQSAMVALGALQKANIKEKEGCHQMLLSSTSQEMASIRLTAINQLDPSVKLDAQRLEFLMVNDPCESVRLTCLQMLAANNTVPKDKLLGCLADDSPSLRERIPFALGQNHPLLREFLQKMIVDQDPYVRLSAIKNFAVQKDVLEGEIQSIFADNHPSIQRAFLEGAANGRWKIPADVLARLKESSIRSIRELAQGIK
jgi:hypothetical protein